MTHLLCKRRTGLYAILSIVLSVMLTAPSESEQSTSLSPSITDSTSASAAVPDTLGYPAFDTRPLRWYSMVTNIPGDYTAFYHAAFRSEYVPLYTFIAGSTAAFLVSDESTWQASNRWYHASRSVGTLSNLFTALGDGTTQFGLGAVFAVDGLIENDPHALRTGSEIVEAVLASGSLVQILKHMTGRQSPFTETRPGGAWRFFPNQIQYHKHVPAYDAYPSGHLTTAIATVVVIAENYPETKWIRPVGYGLSGILAVSMVNRGIHWYSDYPLAIALGYSFGYVIVHPERELQAAPAIGLSEREMGPSGSHVLQMTLQWSL